MITYNGSKTESTDIPILFAIFHVFFGIMLLLFFSLSNHSHLQFAWKKDRKNCLVFKIFKIIRKSSQSLSQVISRPKVIPKSFTSHTKFAWKKVMKSCLLLFPKSSQEPKSFTRHKKKCLEKSCWKVVYSFSKVQRHPRVIPKSSQGHPKVKTKVITKSSQSHPQVIPMFSVVIILKRTM